MSLTLHFPSEQSITSYLEKHPFTNNPYLKEKKIIDAVAKFFANTNKVDEVVTLGVMLTLHNLSKEIELTKEMRKVITMNLIEALKDCAHDKQIV